MSDRPTTITVLSRTGGATWDVHAPRCHKLAHEGMSHPHRRLAVQEAKDILMRHPGAILRVLTPAGGYAADATAEALREAADERGAS